MTSILMIIAPYWHDDMWVFDDECSGMDKEPLVAGIPQIVDDLVRNISDARGGFRLLFSAAVFPGYQMKLERMGEDDQGGGYAIDGRPDEGRVSAALAGYFETVPEAIFVAAEPAGGRVEDSSEEVVALMNRVEELEKAVYRLTMENEFLKSPTTPPPPQSVDRNYWDPEL